MTAALLALAFSAPAALAETVRDEFNAISYAGNDGTLSWSGSWQEFGEANGPASEVVAVVSSNRCVATNCLVIGGDWVSIDSLGALREANLAGATTATLTFTHRLRKFRNTNRTISLEVSANGGTSWTTLATWVMNGGAGEQYETFDISAFASANTQIRFIGSGTNARGLFYIDDIQIEHDGSAPHFAITHDGTGVNCQAENVTITAHDFLHAVFPSYAGTIVLSTSTGHGDWSLVSGSGIFTNAGGGSATYSYDPADAGVVVLGLRDTFSETLNIDVSDGALTEDPTEDPDLIFASAGFSFLADGLASAIGTQIGGKPSNLAPGAQLVELEAIRTSDLTGACEAALQGANAIELASTCVDPATCAGPRVNLNGVDITPNDFGAPLAYTSVTLDFGDDTDTTAPLVIAYPDVGRIQLQARYTLTPSGEDLLGASNVFVVRPFAFEITAPGNPGAILPTGLIFTAAGADFAAAARAVLWQAPDDANGDGRADGHDDLLPSNNAPLADNLSAISYGREAAPEAILLGANLVEPAGGADPGLGGTTTIAAFAAGSGSAPAVFFDEVGIAELSSGVADGDYLGLGAAETAGILGRSGPVGRFTPDHFDVGVDTAPVFQTTCDPGGFTYTGQPFVYAQSPVLRVTARSARDTQTANYTVPWWKITNASLGARTYASDPAAPEGLDTTGLPPTGTDPLIVDLGDGSGTLTFDAGTGLRFDRSAPVAPFDAEIALSIDVIDADGVIYPGNSFQIGTPAPGGGIGFTSSKEMRYGRVAIENAYGSELVTLPVPLRAEYFEGTGFVPNRDDGCTLIATANVGTTARSPVALATTPSVSNAPLLAGDAGLTLSPPGQEGTADLLVNLAGPDLGTPWGVITSAGLPWLQYDWSTGGAGPPDENPTSRATFGIYAGQRPVIFRRELY
jgi:MSHA biogenesis protein MshQ